MRKKFLRKAFLLLALLGIPLSNISAVSWTAGIKDTTDSFQDLPADATLNIAGGNYYVNVGAYNDALYIRALHQDITVNVNGNVTMLPTGAKTGHLIFYAAPDKEITVNVDYDLSFTGTTLGGSTPVAYLDMIVTFSGKGTTRFKLNDYFSGSTCSWRGTTVTFGNQGRAVCPGSDIQNAKTRVYILMDQTRNESIVDGKNKVIFERYYDTLGGFFRPKTAVRVIVEPGSFITYLSNKETGTPDPANGPCDCGYGTLAFDPTTTYDRLEASTSESSGRMVLWIKGDPARDSLDQLDTDCTSTYACSFCDTTISVTSGYYNSHNYYDGGVIVAGHYVPSFAESDIRDNVYLNAHAGIRAIFRIIDDLAFGAGANGYDPTDSYRRGLLVINENSTVPQMAADPYGWHYYVHGVTNVVNSGVPKSTTNPHPNVSRFWANDYSWYRAQYNKYKEEYNYGTNGSLLNVRTGFTLGINGWMDVYHKTFLDYVACHDGLYVSSGELDYFVVQDFGDYLEGDYTTWDGRIYNSLISTSRSWPSMFKFRNPAAFHVDGLNYYSNMNDGVGGLRAYKGGYSGHEQAGDICAQICFYGDAGAFFRVGQHQPYAETDSCQRETFGPWFNSDGDVVFTFTIDSQTYDGEYISGGSVLLPISSTEQSEGIHVIDIEGKLRVDTKLRNDAPGRPLSGKSYAVAGSTEKGFINMPTVKINFRGEEIASAASDDTTTRPLTRDTSYPIYQSPAWFINDTVELYNTRYEHNDVVKAMTTDPYYAPPAILGGERLYVFNQNWSSYSSDQYNAWDEHFEHPKFFLYDSDLNLHESLVTSGIRLVVREERKGNDLNYWANVYGTTANNTSSITFFDHADEYDILQKGYGRLFMVGSGYNTMADGTSNKYNEYGFVNIYRSRKVPSGQTAADTIKLSVQSAFEHKSIHDSTIGIDSSDQGDGSAHFRAYLINDTVSQERDRALHLFLLSRNAEETEGALTGGISYMTLGWTFTLGADTHTPWKAMSDQSLGDLADHFAIGTDTRTPATLSVDGNFVYFGGTDYSGNNAKVPVTSKEQGSTIYVNHGGRITITQPTSGGSFDTSQHGYDCYVDLPIAYRLWTDQKLTGIIDLPKDQVTYGDSCCSAFGRQPYDIDTSTLDANLHLMTWNNPATPDIVPSGRTAADRLSGEEFILAWNARQYKQRGYDHDFIPVKSLPTRYTAVIDQAVTKPENLLYFDANDHITQLKVSGATLADPLHLLITGSSGKNNFGWVKEIVSLRSDPPVWGEGQHGILFLNNDGRVGLGTRDWNDLSENAWHILGKDFVTISPDGNCRVDVHSDLLIADRGAIVPTTNFGASAVQRLTFYSDDAKEIRIPAGGVLDLSAFGNTYRQEIAFGGNIRLIFEPGSTLKFPTTLPDQYPVLYMNDDSVLIFEGDHQLGKQRYENIAETDENKIKIVGYGKIWLNKNATMNVMRNANVAVQSTGALNTDLGISVQREAGIYIGDELMSGGSFEVGNKSNLSGTITFTLDLNGAQSLFHINREGFFGLGVGVINKTGLANGTATSANNPVTSTTPFTWNPSETAWQVQGLYDVQDVRITIGSEGGIIEHYNMFDGTDRRASLWAVGPLSGEYEFSVYDSVLARIRGGGNLMSLTSTTTALVNIWDYADTADRKEAASYGTRYAMFGSLGLIRQTRAADIPNSALTAFGNSGQQFMGGTGDVIDFFTYLSCPLYTSMGMKLVCFSATEYEGFVGYINLSANLSNGKYASPHREIVRRVTSNIYGQGDIELGLEEGVLGSSGETDARSFTVVNRI